MKSIFTFIILLTTVFTFSQNTVSGIVVDEKNNPIVGANIFIEGTYDGVSTDDFGKFSFETSASGNQILVVTFLTFETSKTTIDVTNFKNQTVKMKESINTLDTVIITAGTFKAASIKVAEASKIIENTQRDVNIALINELAMIFSHMGIDTADVIEAAATKWNFIKLQPGLVGGHCIGVDPYYLVQKSISVGHIPDMIRTAREINDGMARFVVGKLVKSMINNDQVIKRSRALVLGVTFKENCPDIRNTKVVDLILEMNSYGIDVDIYDPWVNQSDIESEHGMDVIPSPQLGSYDAIIIAVAHNEFKLMGEKIRGFGRDICTIFDMKNVLGNIQMGQVRL